MLGAGSPIVGVVHQQPRYANPRDVPNLTLWLRGDMGITLNGATVSAWADQSGSGNDVSQATAANQPTFRASGINGQPDLDFDGGDSLVSAAALSAFFGAQAKSLYLVTSIDTIAGDRNLFGDNAGGFFFARSSAVADRLDLFNWDGAAYDIATQSAAADTKYIVHARHDTSNIYLSLNGGTENTVASGATTNLTFAMTLGRGTGGLLDGKIAEVVAYNRALNASERALMLDYLKARYSVA